MRFGWFSLSGALIVCLMLVPNIMYAAKHKDLVNKSENRMMNLLEQIGRYGSMLLMVVSLGTPTGGFGFHSNESFVLWLVLCTALLIAYFVYWQLYNKNPMPQRALMLAIIPSILFISRGAFLEHWILCIFGAVFAVGHIYVTHINNR